ncbi:M48 family metalloprotease [Dyadobacter jiangsuensis]|jgi:Zn-dependent protease with chaperone function|uniref:Peptidase M48-like protein n=1 Tax=Dyadobacter jiangsuensis TaxID=1591085 RepID=A0A2P8G0F1_9BACT|nr:M48 family metalloprotease [Dyadobacter jiangsuensis]PSL27446.1 peptidase M48-like protein [Dyadobacter jiangsuensis]
MKFSSTPLFTCLCCALAHYALAQSEVPVLHTRPTYVVEYKAPHSVLRVNIEEDFNDYYSLIEMSDSVLVFFDKNEKREYERQCEKRERDIQRDLERKQKASAKGQKSKEEKPIPPVDKTPYVKNQSLIKPGLEIEVVFQEYRYSKKFIMQQITILTDLKGTGTLSGTYEQLDGDVATVDGQAVRLNSGAALVGDKGYKGRKFTSFKDMEKGMEMKLRGKRQPDGTLLVDSGTVEPDEFTDTDHKLVQTLKLTKKLSADAGEVSFGNAKFKLLKDETINAYVNRLGKKLVPDHIKRLPKDHPSYLDFNFYVVIDTTFNACAYPDGTVFIHTELLNELSNEAQLAGILGHEIAHVTYRHARQEYSKNQGVSLASAGVKASAALASAYGFEVNDLATYVTAFGGGALSSKYSRELENQADRIGLNYIYEAGYDPREVPKVWHNLRTKNPDIPTKSFAERLMNQIPAIATTAATKGSQLTVQQVAELSTVFAKSIESIYASHPAAGTRYKNLNSVIIRNYQSAELDALAKGEPEYSVIKRRMQRLVKGLSAEDENDAAAQPGTSAKTAKTTQPKRTNTKAKPPVKKKK